MEITTEITGKDYLDFNKYYFKKKRLAKVLVFGLLLSIAIPFLEEEVIDVSLLDILMSIVLFNTIFLGFLYWSLVRASNLPSKKGVFLGNKKYIIGDNEVIEEGENSTSTIKWSGVKSLESGPNAIYLFVDNIAALIIPNRVFINDEARDEFILNIQSKIGKSS